MKAARVASRGGGSADQGTGRVPVLVGRTDELTRLSGLVDAVAGGSGQVVVLSGEPGIGKSRLARELLAACVSRGFTGFAGGAEEVEQRRPFGIVLDALGLADNEDARGDEIRGLLAAERGGLGLEWRIASLLVEVVEEASAAGPVAVLLDDLQWADDSSLLAVKGLARLASAYPLFLVCVSRPHPTGRSLRALLRSLDYQGAEELELSGLDRSDVAQLAATVAGGPVGESILDLLAQADGNPFYVRQLTAVLVREGGAEVSPDGVLELVAGGLAPSLGLTVLEEMRFLPAETLDALRAGAVVGRVFALSEVALISSGSVAEVAAALEPGLRAGVVVPDGQRLAFRHDLVRQAVYADLAPAVRSGLHRYLASRLAETGASVQRVAAQLMLGAEPGDAEAVGWLREAAAEVRASSPPIAADLLLRALELSAGMGARMGVLIDLVRPLLWTGQAAACERVCSEALDSVPPPDEEPLFWMGLANARILQGHHKQALETLERAAGCRTMTESDRLHLGSARALCGLFSGNPAGVELARELVATAPRSIPKGIAQEVIAQWELFTGRADRALAAYEQVDAMREPAVLESRIWQMSGIRVRMWEAVAMLDLDRIDDAIEVLDSEIAAKLAVPALPHAFLAACRYHQGRFEEALAECEAAIAAAQDAGSFAPASAPALAATIALRQGRLEDAGCLVERAEELRQPAEAVGDTIARWARTLLLEASGEVEQAADAARDALQAYTRAGFASYIAWHSPDLVRVALAAGRRDQAEQAVDAAERVTAQLSVTSRRACALRARGLLAGDSALLEQALAAVRQAPRPIDLALTLRDTAASLAADGRQQDARALADEALALLAALGAAGDERNARQVLRAAGLKPSSRAKHTHADSGWESLTEAELKVVELAAQGRSNPEIAQALYVSRRTVGWHLSNIYTKLDVSSRGELAAAAVRRELG